MLPIVVILCTLVTPVFYDHPWNPKNSGRFDRWSLAVAVIVNFCVVFSADLPLRDEQEGCSRVGVTGRGVST